MKILELTAKNGGRISIVSNKINGVGIEPDSDDRYVSTVTVFYGDNDIGLKLLKKDAEIEYKRIRTFIEGL